MKYVAILVCIALLFDTIQLRWRLARVRSLPPRGPDGPQESAGEFLVMDGVRLDAETRRDAAAFAHARGLGLIDLVPRRLSALDVVALARLIDPRSDRTKPFSRGRTAQHAAFVASEIAERAGIEGTTFDEPATFIATIARLTRYAGSASDVVVAPRLPASAAGPAEVRRGIPEAIHGVLMMRVLTAGKLLVMGLIVVALALPGARLWGAVALALFHLQPGLAILGTPFRPRDLLAVTLFRLPMEVWRSARLFVSGSAGGEDPWERARPVYARLLAEGTQRFFEPRRDSCPLCDSHELAVHLRSGDLIQLKPGRFTLERCRGCGHIFQNPRLSQEGLSFYYKDAYDGLFETTTAGMFAGATRSYRDRARMVRGAVEPKRWLDVGAGHAHFCVIAREEWPGTRFDVLDYNEEIQEAARCGWADQAYVGLFPALVPSFEGEYDVVSMSHYLEHTIVPRAEIAAARRALAPEGCLLIEVPDPACRFARLLGRLWGPWLQPQHLHFLSTQNLEKILREEGFSAITWQRREAHFGADLSGALVLTLNRLGPLANLPWRTPRSRFARSCAGFVWLIGFVPLVLASWADVALRPLLGPLGLSNSYRVLARRKDTGTGTGAVTSPV